MKKIILCLVAVLSIFFLSDNLASAKEKKQEKKATGTKTEESQKESDSQKKSTGLEKSILQQVNLSSDNIDIITMLAKINWNLRINYESDQYKKVSPEQLKAVLQKDDFIPTMPEMYGLCDEDKVKTLWNTNRDSIIEYVGNATLLGGDFFYYIQEPSEILSFVSYKDHTYILLDAIGVETIFNTLRLQSKDRAKKIFDQYAVEALSKLSSKPFKGIEGAILVVTYGSKNFLDKSRGSNLKPEAILVISSFDNIRRFKNGDIDDQEFAKNTIIFLSDRDSVTEARRVNLLSQ